MPQLCSWHPLGFPCMGSMRGFCFPEQLSSDLSRDRTCILKGNHAGVKGRQLWLPHWSEEEAKGRPGQGWSLKVGKLNLGESFVLGLLSQGHGAQPGSGRFYRREFRGLWCPRAQPQPRSLLSPPYILYVPSQLQPECASAQVGARPPMSNTMPGQETGDSAEAGPRNSQLAAPGHQLPNKSKGGTVWWLRGASARPVCSLGFTPRFLRFELLLWTSQFISNCHTACTQATALAPIHAELQLSALGTGASLPASPAHTSPQDAASLPTRCQHPISPGPLGLPEPIEGTGGSLNLAKWEARLYHSS